MVTVGYYHTRHFHLLKGLGEIGIQVRRMNEAAAMLTGAAAEGLSCRERWPKAALARRPNIAPSAHSLASICAVMQRVALKKLVRAFRVRQERHCSK